MTTMDTGWSRAVDADVAAVHGLLVASDAHHARTYGIATPERSVETTRRRVADGVVHVLRQGADPVAMFTLTDRPPFAQSLDIFPPARQPAYLQRLAVTPAGLADGPFIGLRCLRRATTLAVADGADALRAEA